MEDLFYFTHDRVTLADVGAVARQMGYTTSGGTHRHLRVEHSDGWWECADLPLDYKGFNALPLRKVAEYAPRFQLMVTYSEPTLPRLKEFLRQLLLDHGGWVGCDDDMEIVYDLSNIDSIECGHDLPP